MPKVYVHAMTVYVDSRPVATVTLDDGRYIVRDLDGKYLFARQNLTSIPEYFRRKYSEQ